MIDISHTLKALRLAEGRKQSEVAKQLGVTASAVSAYENGLRQPSYEVLIKFASLYKVTTDFLLGCEKKDHSPNCYSLDGLTQEQVETVLKLIKTMKTANYL